MPCAAEKTKHGRIPRTRPCFFSTVICFSALPRSDCRGICRSGKGHDHYRRHKYCGGLSFVARCGSRSALGTVIGCTGSLALRIRCGQRLRSRRLPVRHGIRHRFGRRSAVGLGRGRCIPCGNSDGSYRRHRLGAVDLRRLGRAHGEIFKEIPPADARVGSDGRSVKPVFGRAVFLYIGRLCVIAAGAAQSVTEPCVML